MALFTLFDEFKSDLGKAVHNFSSHTLKAVLTNTAPDVAANTILANITQIAAGNGYTTGGVTLTSVTWAETSAGSGIFQLTFADPAWTASGGDIATHRYMVVYNDTPTSPADPLIGYVDKGSSSVITSGQTFTWDVGTSGVFQIDG